MPAKRSCSLRVANRRLAPVWSERLMFLETVLNNTFCRDSKKWWSIVSIFTEINEIKTHAQLIKLLIFCVWIFLNINSVRVDAFVPTPYEFFNAVLIELFFLTSKPPYPMKYVPLLKCSLSLENKKKNHFLRTLQSRRS